jgi:hypothetical protein
MHAHIVPPLVRGLQQLRHLFSKGAKHAEAQGWEPAVVLGLRLAPDMFPLIRQAQIATDICKNAAARLAAVEAPKFADDETGFDEIDARIGRALDFILSLPAEAFAEAAGRAIQVPTRRGELQFSGHDYLYDFVLPNLHFHTSIAYALLRGAGVPLGKADFLGPIGGVS